ncbi:NB-ARC domain, LRR domain containing protein, partial [Parasponia andersonii]
MAETFLSPIIQKLVKLLAEEVNFVKGVHKEAKSLKDELEIIQPFLKDAEAKVEKGELGDATKVWLKQIKEETDRIEDVIDEYIHFLEMKRHRHPGHQFINSIQKACLFVNSIKPGYGVAAKIRDRKESLREIKERGQSYGLRPFEKGSGSRYTAEGNSSIDPRLGSLFIEADDLVGIDSTSNYLIRKLVEGPSSRMVISLVGEGGIGKTTLAKKVYDDNVVKGHFDCYAWITVSQSYNMKIVLKIMISQIFPNKEEPVREIDTVEELIDLLRSYFQTKRYVVVFDDVWQTDFWEVIKHTFPNKTKGDRIIITTRNNSVAYTIKETPFDFVQELKPWGWDLAWELFCKKAFPLEFERRCPQELDHLSREFVKYCQGLPLVIVAIAGLLSTKQKIEFEWKRILDNLNFEFESNPQLMSVSKILSFGYYDLPDHLKACFLYFGMFPNYNPVFEHRLYRLWIAEGFIKSSKDKTLEQVAQEYLSELIHRNLVSFSLRRGFQLRCKVHDVMRDIILTRADELGFYQILNKSKPRFKGKSRRLSVYSTTKDVLKIVGDSSIRTVILFDIDELSKSFVVNLFKNFKLLKALDFENAPLDDLPKEVGNLIHLKYLNLDGTKVKKIPKSIGNLSNLQTLNLYNTLVKELPIEINYLRNMQRLSAKRYNKKTEYSLNSYGSVRLHEGIGSLEELQTLTFMEACDDGVDLVKE